MGLLPSEPGKRIHRAREDAVQAVVVPRRDGVVLVIVAARTGDRQAEKRLTQRVDRILDVR